MRVAICGAGFSGLAAAYHFRSHDVVVFDPNGVGAGASGAASGLLHPFPGASGKRSPRGREAMAESLCLLRVAEEALGRPVCDRTPIVRMPVDDGQKRRFAKMGHLYDGVTWDGKTLSIRGVTVFPKRYLEGLLLASGARFVKGTLEGEFDLVVWAIGAALDDPRVQKIKGQVLVMAGEGKSTISHGYTAVAETGWHFGSTYEHHFESEAPDIEVAKKLLLKKWGKLPGEPIGCKAGVRVAQKGDVYPLVFQRSEKEWVITGMGSRGLLYHALVAKELAALFCMG